MPGPSGHLAGSLPVPVPDGQGHYGWVVSRHGLEQDRTVFHRPCHRPGVIERESKRQDAGAADPSILPTDNSLPIIT